MDIMTSATAPNETSVEHEESRRRCNDSDPVPIHDRELDRATLNISTR